MAYGNFQKNNEILFETRKLGLNSKHNILELTLNISKNNIYLRKLHKKEPKAKVSLKSGGITYRIKQGSNIV